MTVDPRDLANLDVTIADFVIPRLEAFREFDRTFPEDLNTIGEWHAELTTMLNAWRDVSVASANGEAEYAESTRAGLRLFSDRLGDLWL